MAVNAEPCICGSGRDDAACHARPQPWSPAVARELDALAQIHDLPMFFPFLRPRAAVFVEYAESAAFHLGPQESPVPAAMLEEALGTVSSAERRRLVRAYERRHADVWRILRHAAGGRDLAARVLAAGAIRLAIDERRARPRVDIAALEDMPDEHHCLNALVAIVNAGWVWTVDDGWAALSAAAPGSPRTEAWLSAAEQVASGRAGPPHLYRVRELTGRLARQLPAPGLPRASARLKEACDLVTRDESAAYRVVGMLLVAYASHLEAHAQMRRAAQN